MPAPITAPITFAIIERRICRVFRITVDELNAKGRKGRVTVARQAVMYWAARLTALSPKMIGQRMGGRDHSTVYFGIDRYPERRAKQGRNLRKIERGEQPVWLKRGPQ